MEFALAVLLVSSFASVGLLALWAATSRRHWFLRTTVFVSVLSLLLLIPAHEPFVAFTLLGATVAAGIHLARLFQRSKSANSGRFSLATLLQLMLLASVGAAVAPRLPTLNLLAWQSVTLIGISSGLATLVAHWIVQSRSIRWQWRIAVALILTAVISLPLIFGDWFVLSIASWSGWPPEKMGLTFGFMSGSFYGEEDAIVFWFPVMVGVVGLLGILSWLAFSIIAPVLQEFHRPWQRIFSRFALLLSSVLLLLPSISVYYQLMTPSPIPIQKMPADNGYHDLIAAGHVAEKWDFNTTNYDADTAPEKELRAAVAKMQVAYDKVKVGLGKDVLMPIDYHTVEGYGMPDLSALRSLARSLAGKAQLARRQGRHSEALVDYLDTIKLGYAIRKETLMVNALVGVAINGVGQRGLYELKPNLNWEKSMQAIDLLKRLEIECESVEGFIHRDRVWSQHSNGWHGHLQQIIAEFGDPDWFSSDESVREAFRREIAISRLLCAELALQAFHNLTGNFPIDLEELVPDYLSRVPNDPFSPDSLPLRYRCVDENYVLYSVGTNGKDDSGILPIDYEEPSFWYMDGGDLRLEYFYAPDPSSEFDPAAENYFGEEQEP